MVFPNSAFAYIWQMPPWFTLLSLSCFKIVLPLRYLLHYNSIKMSSVLVLFSYVGRTILCVHTMHSFVNKLISMYNYEFICAHTDFVFFSLL